MGNFKMTRSSIFFFYCEKSPKGDTVLDNAQYQDQSGVKNLNSRVPSSAASSTLIMLFVKMFTFSNKIFQINFFVKEYRECFGIFRNTQISDIKSLKINQLFDRLCVEAVLVLPCSTQILGV
jgi:hypothetical protein